MSKALVIKSEEQRLVYGEVYAPMQIDTDGEAMTADEVQKMAHHFLSVGRTNKIDVSHDGTESGCLVVESFLARKNDPDGFVLGAWVLGVKVLPDELWAAVKSGEINGFSFAGAVNKTQISTTVTSTRLMKGITEKSEPNGLLPTHDHEVEISFTKDGTIVPCKTNESLGHTHKVLKTTATERSMEHAHRMILIDNQEEN